MRNEDVAVMLRITKDNVNNAHEKYIRGHYAKAERLLADILDNPQFKKNTDERIVALKIGLIDRYTIFHKP